MQGATRRATPEDRDRLVALMAEYYRESGYPFHRTRAASAFEAVLQDPHLGAVWTLHAGDDLAGYVVLTLGFSLEYGGRDAFVDDLFVRPAHRRQGLGRLGLATLLDECRGLGVRAVHLEVERDNRRARRLYADTGFAGGGRELLTLRMIDDDADA